MMHDVSSPVPSPLKATIVTHWSSAYPIKRVWLRTGGPSRDHERRKEEAEFSVMVTMGLIPLTVDELNASKEAPRT